MLALGCDPYFAGWPDTLQLDYSNPATQEAMAGELLRIAGQCDGVRCDMAMLVLPDVFERTWGRRAPLFWPDATRRVRENVPGFCFMAEVYWDLEWTMQEQGFDYAYDKRLYDRLRDRDARSGRGHSSPGSTIRRSSRASWRTMTSRKLAATFEQPVHEAAAVITYLTPGLRFFHQGQFEGRRKRISPHLVRAPLEPSDTALQQFYERLRAVLQQPAFPATVNGGCSSARQRGMETGPSTVSWRVLERRRRRPLAGGRQLRGEPEPVPRSGAASGSRRQRGAI